MTTRSAWAAWVELISGVSAFALALLTWALWLFAPLYEERHGCDRLGCPHIIHFSLVEGTGGLSNFARQFPGLSLLIVAFVVTTGLVAAGAYLHGWRHMATGRLLVWGGGLLLPLLLSLLLAVMSILGRLAAGPAIGWYTLVLGLGTGLCAGLGLIASVAAGRAEIGGGAEQEHPQVARTRRSARVEVLAGAAAFALALLTWALWLFAPLHKVRLCDQFGCPHTISVSLVEAADGLDTIIRLLPSISLLIPAFLILSGLVAAGAYLHGWRHMATGRLLVWGGGLLLPLVVSALSALPLQSVLPLGPIPPNLEALGVQSMTPGPDMLVLGLGPGLCAGLALIASVAAMRAEGARRWAA